MNRIGFVGLGQMGSGIATNLLSNGHDLTVHDISITAGEDLVRRGAKWAATPMDVASNSDVVFTSLPTPQIVEAVCWGDDGLSAAMRPGTAWFDLSTNAIEVVRRIHARMNEQGVSFLDAPVSGGPKGAASGQLAIWVGGDEDTYRHTSDILNVVGDQARYIGPIGAGTIAKLVHNMASTAVKAVLAEVLSMGVKSGLEPLPLWSAIREGAAGRVRTFDNITRFLQGDLDRAAFRLELLHKDVELALQMGRDSGVPMRLCSLVGHDVTEALNRGWGDRDSQSIMALQVERSGISTLGLTPDQVEAVMNPK